MSVWGLTNGSLSRSLPGPVGNWLTRGDKEARNKKAILIACLSIALILLALLCLVGLVGFVYAKNQPEEWDDSLLPEWAVPSSYQINVIPDLASSTFQGTVQVAFTVSLLSLSAPLSKKMVWEGH